MRSDAQKKAPRLWIGTSGWVYKHWGNGVFYPKNLPTEGQLEYYAEHFTTVEVNFSFYRLPERSVFENWRAETPKGFIFAVKASRYLTHLKKLKDPEEPLERLMNRASGLEEKLGPILLQFPPNWPVHLERLGPFLELIKTYRGQRFAFEFRHPSWLNKEVYKLLERARAGLVLPVASGMPIDVRLTAPWSYIRFHHGKRGIGFSGGQLTAWSNTIRSFMTEGADVYAYFNNDAKGFAVRDAKRLRDMLEQRG